MIDPTTPPEVLTVPRRSGWKPDRQGRLLFATGRIGGGNYVIETVDQLNRVKAYERNKNGLTVVAVGAALGAFTVMQPKDTTVSTAVGSMIVVLVLVGVLLGYVIRSPRRLVTDTGMRLAT